MANTPKLVESYVPRQIQALGHGLKLPATLAPNAGDIPAGHVMGVRTSDGMMMPVRRAPLAANAASGATSLKVGEDHIHKFKVGDTVAIRARSNGQVQNLGAVTAVTADSITVTTALSAAHNANAADVYVADGSEVARAILEYSVLNDSLPQQISPFVLGVFYEAELVGLDDIAIADLGARRLLNGLIKV